MTDASLLCVYHRGVCLCCKRPGELSNSLPLAGPPHINSSKQRVIGGGWLGALVARSIVGWVNLSSRVQAWFGRWSALAGVYIAVIATPPQSYGLISPQQR